MSQIVLTAQQFDDLACEFVNQLHEIPLYDVARKQRLASEYLRRVQSLLAENIVANINELPEDSSVLSVLLAERLSGYW